MAQARITINGRPAVVGGPTREDVMKQIAALTSATPQLPTLPQQQPQQMPVRGVIQRPSTLTQPALPSAAPPQQTARTADVVQSRLEQLGLGGFGEQQLPSFAGSPLMGGAPVATVSPRTPQRHHFLETLLSRDIADLVGAPQGIYTTLAAGVEAAAGMMAGLGRGEPLDPVGRFNRATAAAGREGGTIGDTNIPTVSAAINRVLPNPSQETVRAATAAGGRAFGPEFEQELANVMDLNAQFPNITKAANLGAIPISFLLARGPFGRRVPPPNKAELAKTAEDFAKEAFKHLPRTAARSAARGAFESAVLSVIRDDTDPAVAAAANAGAALAGEIALTGIRRVPKTSGTFFTLWFAHEVWRALLPGPQSALESKDDVVREAITGFGLYTLAGLSGAGGNKYADVASRLKDGLTTMLRGTRTAGVSATIKALRTAFENGDNRLETVLGVMSEDPDFFGRETRIRLERAMMRGDAALERTVDQLFQSQRFLSRLDERGEG